MLRCLESQKNYVKDCEYTNNTSSSDNPKRHKHHRNHSRL